MMVHCLLTMSVARPVLYSKGTAVQGVMLELCLCNEHAELIFATQIELFA